MDRKLFNDFVETTIEKMKTEKIDRLSFWGVAYINSDKEVYQRIYDSETNLLTEEDKVWHNDSISIKQYEVDVCEISFYKYIGIEYIFDVMRSEPKVFCDKYGHSLHLHNTLRLPNKKRLMYLNKKFMTEAVEQIIEGETI